MAALAKVSQSQEHNMYIAQLRDVFDSCDETGSSQLNREELLILCDKLQLEDQSEFLVNELLKDKDAVDFEEFQVSFVNILCQTYSTKGPSSEEEVSSESETDGEDEGDDKQEGQFEESNEVKREVSPKYALGEKRYGRRSLPSNLDDLALLDMEDIEVASSTMSLKHSLTVEDDTDSEEDDSESHKKRRRKDGQDTKETETFEAEGQLNLMMADSETLTEEEQYLHGIWTNLGVGENGFIDIEELARVCSHIGMEEMNDSQLQQLFDKLDADGDGRVSFREFLNELFQHNTPPTQHDPLASRSKGMTPTRALSAQKKLKFPGSEERTTPSIVQGTGVTGLFSAVDPERTGFAKPDAITDFWEKYNLTNGADVLVALGFDLNTKVNLSELSAALEQELLNSEDQSVVYQAATASYQQEIRHLKSALEQAVWAKDKLKLDLAEANSRNSMLAKEVDERHANMEKSSQSRLLSIEQKYQDQVKVLQGELDREKENIAQLSVRHKQNLEKEMDELRQEEAKLREHLVQAQKEIEKQGHDLEEVTGQLDESEKVGERLQRELESVQDLHAKLAEYESKGVLSPEEQKFTQEKLHRLELENKDLKDHNDELTAELETTKQQTGQGRRPGEDDGTLHTPIRKDGSIMSDYIKPMIIKKDSCSSADCSDDEGRTGTSQGRKMPSTFQDDDDIRKNLFKSSTHQKLLAGVGDPSDKDTIEQLRKELVVCQEHFEIDRREIEQACRLEITAAEERQDQEKANLLQHIENEKSNISNEFERLQQEALSELARELQTKFAHEKEKLVHKHESQKNHMEQKFQEEKEKLLKRLSAEHKSELDTEKQEITSRFEQEKYQLEETLADTEPFIHNLEEEKSRLEQKLAMQKDQNEKNLKKQKAEMEDLLTRHMQNLEDAEKKKHDMEINMKKQINDLDMKHKNAILDLESEIDRLRHSVREEQKKGAELQLEMRQQKEELQLSFRQEKQEILELYEDKMKELEDSLKDAEKTADDVLTGGVECLQGKLKEDFYKLLDASIVENLKKEKTVLVESVQLQKQTEFDTKQSELSHVFEREKAEIKERYEEQIEALKGELGRLQVKLEEEREALAQRYECEKEALEDQLVQQIRDELESAKWRKRVRHGRKALKRNREEEFVQQMEEIKEAYEDEKREFESQSALLRQEVEDLQQEVEAGDQNRKKMDDLKRTNTKLLQEKRRAEKGQADLRKTLEESKKSLEARIDELMAEKEGAITAVKTQFVESSKQNGKERAAFDALLMEKEGLERRVTSLTQELTELQNMTESSMDTQKQIERLTRENEDLRNRSSETGPSGSSVPEHAQAAFDALLMEKEGLERRVTSLTQELTELQNMTESSMDTQKQIERLTRENEDLRNRSSETGPSGSSVPEHAQRAISELTCEKRELEEQLVDIQNRYEEIEDLAKKYSHLQFDYGQMSIGHSVVEESLLETQDHLADTEAKLNQSERELRDARRYKDKYRLLQKKYEDVYKERDKMSHLAKSLKEQLNKANTAQKEEHEDKGQLTSVLEEKKLLELQLQKISDKLLEATTNFSVSQSQHIQELQQWKEQCSNMVDLQKYTKLQIDLVDNQRSLRDLQGMVKNKEETSTNKFKETSEKHHEQVKWLENQKDALSRQLTTLQNILDGQIDKFKQQYEASERRNALVVDLYKENADLIDSLYHVERQKKEAISRCYKLEDQCINLRKMLKRVAKVAIT